MTKHPRTPPEHDVAHVKDVAQGKPDTSDHARKLTMGQGEPIKENDDGRRQADDEGATDAEGSDPAAQGDGDEQGADAGADE